jgi:hypothetical protein
MRKFIVSTLAVIAVTASGFLLDSILNTKEAYAWAPIVDTGELVGSCMVCVNGNRSWHRQGFECGYSC